MKTYKLYAGGYFQSSKNELDVTNPYTGKVFARVCQADKTSLEGAIKQGLLAEKELKSMPVYQKVTILNAFAKALHQNLNELAHIITQESGKPVRYAKAEVERASQTFSIAAEECKRIPGEYMSLDWTAVGRKKEAWVKYFPLGLVAGISPFNFPLNLAAHKIAPALAAGNPIIIKPSSKTPVSILRLAELVHDDFLPDGAFSVLPMERKLGDKLITDERIKLLSFTGSPAVGWAMKNKAGKKRVLLELGGNAGVYVGDTADVGLAIKRCITGGYAYSGQVCIHVQRIFVHHKVFESFITGFVKGVEGLKVGSPDDPQTDISTMIDEDNAKRVQKWVNDALDQGAELLHGGERSGGYYPPTVLTGTNNKMKVCAEEVFGPVVTVESVESFDQGMDLINDSQYGLQAGVFTNRLDEMDRAFAGLEVGGIIINDMPTFRVDHMPYGGVKNSGFGREGVRYAIQEMTEPRLLVKSKAD